MSNFFQNSFEYKLIYIFEVNDEAHRGLLKIGDTTLQTDKAIDSLRPNCHDLNQAAIKRIKSYTNTVGITPNLLHTELAVRIVKDREGNLAVKAFRDHDVHRVLLNSGINKKQVNNSTSREWFDVDLQTVLKAIDAVKKNQPNLGNVQRDDFVPIVFRPEQEEAIKKTVKQFKNNNRMLWNAKMRFGKTLSALQVVKECEFDKTIIITHRPVVDAGWYEDFGKIFHGMDEYVYGSKNNGATIEYLLSTKKKFIYFASIQDLRGSSLVSGKYDKNDVVFSTEWDFVIVDEAHEGTTTSLGDDVIRNIVKSDTTHDTKFLALSGTPFNILNDYDDNVYTWDYVMEQRCKTQWDEMHFGDSNPYDELPELKIYTYDLGKIINNKSYVELEDKAFNFREFFRTWTGDVRSDRKSIPEGKEVGDFYHEKDVWSFLNLITKESDDSYYPYASKEYRELFKHSLWMVPGVREARALSKLMKKHPVFGSGMFDIVNVAGDGDEEEKSEDALKKVRSAIKGAGEGYTITLSCGKLTTGVTVPEWTAVFMLAGSFSTSAANYLQTIFRVQSPCNIDGKIKKCCYVFDFAPDRTLKMVAESVALSTKAGKANETDKRIMGEFLNYCPVISVEGTMMKIYDTNKLLQQLKRAYAERAVKNGFDDVNLYNDELLKMDDLDIEQFNQLKGIVGTSKAASKSTEIDINHQGFTEEEYEEIERIQKKPKRERTPEEEERLKEVAEQKKQKNNAISILRGVSIRIPLLIYGADVDIDEDITIDKMVDIVDDSSWLEFMPTGVTKDIFKRFIKYYDSEIFVAAGRKIRNTVLSADELPPTERVKKIAELFSCFKNPDKETVLTPWRVVNMHMSDCLGGYDFYDEEHNTLIEVPRYVDRGKVTQETVDNKDAKILEINSKTGLYPLYVAYSVYRAKCKQIAQVDLTIDVENQMWRETVQENIFVICKTEMAKSITKRTLMGYREGTVNAHYFENLINMLENKTKHFSDKVLKASYWKKEGVEMKFDAVVGNPPYQMETGGAGRQAKPIYNLFVEQGKELNPNYLSMITPSRWFAGGMGLDEFRNNMMNDGKVVKLVDYTNAKDCFPQISISGGVCYFLWSNKYDADCEVTNVKSGQSNTLRRPLNEFPVFVRYNEAISILHKVMQSDDFASIDSIISPLMPYGLSTNYRGIDRKTEENSLKLYASDGVTYIKPTEISKGLDTVDKYKVMISKMSAEHAGEPNKEGKFNVITKSMQVIGPKEVCTHSYFLIGNYDSYEEADNTYTFLKTQFARFLVLMSLSAVNLSKLVFSFVPLLDFKQRWTDEELYKKYGLDENEIEFINSIVRPLEW